MGKLKTCPLKQLAPLADNIVLLMEDNKPGLL
jgi:hypothetical protein